MVEVHSVLREFAKAWSARDLDAVMAFFSETAIYAASVGPGPGRTAQGKASIRSLIETMFAVDSEAVAETSDPVIFEGGAFWTWRYTLPDGRIELGCDFLRVEGGKITLKDAYRKVHA